MGNRASLNQVVKDFEVTLAAARRLFVTIKGSVDKSAHNPPLHFGQARRVVGLAFLMVTASWEEFLEQCFVRYLMGVSSPDGTVKPTLKMGKCPSIRHAYMLLEGYAYSPEKDFIIWSVPSKVRERANVFFKDGKPFDATRDRSQQLIHAVSIRNRVAHKSTKARADFKDAALALRSQANRANGGKLPQGYSPGDLLVEKPANFYGQPGKDMYLFEHYVDVYQELAKEIAP